MNTRATITALGNDLDSYLDSNYSGNALIQDVEYDYRSLQSLEGDYNINTVRIGLFEQPEDVLTRVADNEVLDVTQAYLMQVFYVVPRRGDYDTNIEFDLFDIQDDIFQWAYEIDAGSVTSNELYTLQWDSINRVDRQDFYALLEINLAGFRET